MDIPSMVGSPEFDNYSSETFELQEYIIEKHNEYVANYTELHECIRSHRTAYNDMLEECTEKIKNLEMQLNAAYKEQKILIDMVVNLKK